MERLIVGVGGVAGVRGMESKVSRRGNKFGGLLGWVVVGCSIIIVGSGSIRFGMGSRG